jgi:hypothetical protein
VQNDDFKIVGGEGTVGATLGKAILKIVLIVKLKKKYSRSAAPEKFKFT